VLKANWNYHWENWQLSYDGKDSLIASGNVMSDGNGILTVTNFKVSPAGNRLIITP
jgi:hypothetical protein